MTDRAVSRRAALRGVGVLAATALAGCGGGGIGGSTPAGGSTSAGGSTTAADGTGTTTDAAGPGPVALRTVATGFRAPLDLADPPDAGWRYVADQQGVVSTVGADGGVEPALDLREQVVTARSEQGLLGIALHPDFPSNRRLYVRYSAERRAGTPAVFSHTFVLAEFEASADGTVDPETERTVLEIPEPQWNHNSGGIAFGPDGYLYVGVGDGGAGGDAGPGHVSDWYAANAGGNGQDVEENLLGSILRIDVDERPSSAGGTGSDAGDGGESGRAYGIPEDNPLVGEDGLDEHWAWGFRNPWRFSFDGDALYVGDVGQQEYEEVDRVRRGGNYGWNVREGAHCYGAEECPTETPDGQPLIEPIVEYPHSGPEVSGISVIGGHVYRGDAAPGLGGAYVFGDLNAQGRLFLAERPDGAGQWPTSVLPVVEADRPKLERLLSFGRDGEDRLYVLARGAEGGGVHEVVGPA